MVLDCSKKLLTLLILISPCISQNQHEGKSVALREIYAIGDSENTQFVQVGEIASDSKSSIYVSDQYQYLVKKFNSEGIFQTQFGKRGREMGEFESGPYKINCVNDTLAIVSLGSSKVQFFTNNFMPVNQISAVGAIVDVCCNHNGQVFVATVQSPSKFENTLMLYDKHGKVISKLILKGGQKDPVLDMISIYVDVKDYLIVVFKFVNRVVIYDARQNYVTDFKIPNLPDASPMEMNSGELSSMPDQLFNDVVADTNGNIFILGGFFSPYPNQDVYVVKYNGNVQTMFTLPDQSGILHIDRKGFLYTRERKRSMVKKYEMKYINF
jgi:hypothetical protein